MSDTPDGYKIYRERQAANAAAARTYGDALARHAALFCRYTTFAPRA